MEMQHSTSSRNRNQFIRFGLILMLLAFFGQSANADWVSIGLEGKAINAVLETEAGILFAGSDSSIFKTSDNGLNWIETNTGMGTVNVQDIVSVNNILYAATAANGVFKSTDEGANWTAINTGLLDLSVKEMVIDPTNPDILYAGTSNGVFKTIDAGVSWFSANNGLSASPILALAIDPVTVDTLYAGFQALSPSTYTHAMYKTSDGGANWFVEVDGTDERLRIDEIFVNPARSSDVYYNAKEEYDPVFSSFVVGYPFIYRSNISSGTPADNVILVDPAHPFNIYEGHSNYTCLDREKDYHSSYCPSPDGVSSFGAVLKFDQNGWAGIDTGLQYSVGLNHSVSSNRDIHDLTFGKLDIGLQIHFLYAATSNGVYSINEFALDDGIANILSSAATIQAKNNQLLGTYIYSNPVCVSGINVPVPVGAYESYGGATPEMLELYPELIEFFSPPEVIVTNGEYSVNGNPFTSAQGQVFNGDCIRLRVMSSPAINTTVETEVGMGQALITFSAKTGPDRIPDVVSFTDQVDVQPNTVIYSNPVVVAGLTDGSSAGIRVKGGEYSINGSAYVSTVNLAVYNNDIITLRATSSANSLESVSVELTFASYYSGGTGWVDTTSIFTITTQFIPVTVPDAFAFTDQSDIALNTQIFSDNVIITGINTSSPISITGGEYSINGGAYTSVSGNINAGDTVSLRIISSTSGSTSVDVVLTIGGISDTFSVTTDADLDGDGIGNLLDINDDGDGYNDLVDNCILAANDQLDTDNDGYGNACDSDFNNDGTVNSLDIGLFRAAFFSTGSQQTDLNGDGFVNSLDIGLFRPLFLQPPGPSGLVP